MAKHDRPLISGPAIKEFIDDYQISSDFLEALDREVRVLIVKAVTRCESNSRKRVLASDL